MTEPTSGRVQPWWRRLGAGICEIAGGHFLALPADRCPFCRRQP